MNGINNSDQPFIESDRKDVIPTQNKPDAQDSGS